MSVKIVYVSPTGLVGSPARPALDTRSFIVTMKDLCTKIDGQARTSGDQKLLGNLEANVDG